MKVIMLVDVKGKGKRGEVKDFPNGFANFLIKNKQAVDATPANMNKLKQQQAEEEKQAELRLEEAKALKADLEQKTVIVKVKAGDNVYLDLLVLKQLQKNLKNNLKLN